MDKCQNSWNQNIKLVVLVSQNEQPIPQLISFHFWYKQYVYLTVIVYLTVPGLGSSTVLGTCT